MSGYWDALARAALDMPGSAVPRVRSLFEPDDLRAETRGPDIGDELVDDPIPQPRQPGSRRPLPGIPAVPDADEPVADPLAAAPDPPRSSPARREPPTPLQPTTEAAPAAVKTGAGPADPPAPAAVPSPVRVEREHVERRRFEVEAPGWRGGGPAVHPVDDLPASPAAVVQAPVAVPRDEPSAPDGQPTPTVVAARPLAPAQADAPVTSEAPRELQPLIIEIDRIEIRIDHEPASAPSVAPAPDRRTDIASVPTLGEYLAGRSEARR